MATKPWCLHAWMRVKIGLLKRGWSKSVSLTGRLKANQPLMIRGKGSVVCFEDVTVGDAHSPGFLSTESLFSLNGEGVLIRLEKGVRLNNNTSLLAEGASIYIGEGTVAGANLLVRTCDIGHPTQPAFSVIVGKDVLIGDNVLILKGVTIGNRAVIESGSVVTQSIPAGVLAAGNPCCVVRPLI